MHFKTLDQRSIMPKISGLLKAVTMTTFASIMMIGCAQERDTIDRVQPNYYKKSYFEGEWHYQRTVVSVPSGSVFTSVGMTDHSGMTRVSFDIQENFLYARRTTEFIKDGDDRDAAEDRGDQYEGEVVAAFRILSHFDIQPAYNPSTGEELNILNENTTDRPWYERDYIRVDWSKNEVTNLSLDFEAASIEPVSYFVQEFDDATGERHRDAPVFEGPVHGEGTEGEYANANPYFDITSRIFAKAGSFYYPGYGDIPLCWLNEFNECGSSEYGIRHSFNKMDPEHQYAPTPYKGAMTEMFGYFWTDRNVFTDRGVFEQNRERYMNRHNLFKTWFDEDGDVLDPDERELKPIIYYVNRDWPSEDEDPVLNEVAQEVADQWNDIFEEAVDSMGADRDGQDMFILCPHNPVQDGDPSECGEEGFSPRMGDLRYSFMAWVPNYTQGGLLGLGPSNNDPETGEIVSGIGYIYESNDRYAYQTMEMIDLLRGADVTNYIEGLDLRNWVERVDMTANQAREQRWTPLSEAEYFVEQRFSPQRLARFENIRKDMTQFDQQMIKEDGFAAWRDQELDRISSLLDLNMQEDKSARLEALVGTPYEKQLLTDDLLAMNGFDPDLPVTEDTLDRISPLRAGNIQYMMGYQKAFENFAAQRNAYLPAMADDALTGLAKEYAASNLSRDEIFQEVRKRLYTAVLAHEVGHSIGLMHNFGASDDAMNYFDDYWEIRAADGAPGPRENDPITQYEIDNSLYNYAYSSVMDYAGRLTIDGEGLGKYDRAAILFGYANKVEVFNNDYGLGAAGTLQEWHTSDGDILTSNPFFGGLQTIHYTKLYNDMGADLYDDGNRELVDFTDLNDDLYTTTDGRHRVPYIYCSHGRSDIGDSCLTRDFGADAGERMHNMIDNFNTWYILRAFPRGQLDGRHQSIYRKWRSLARLKDFHNLYGLYVDLFSGSFTPAQAQSFFMDPVSGFGQKTAAVQNAFNYLMQTLTMPDVGTHYRQTQADGTELLEWIRDDDITAQFPDEPLQYVGIEDGRYYQTSWSRGDNGSRNCGYFWYECLHHVGFYVDKILATLVLSDSSTYFVTRSTPKDIREWEVSFYSTFPEQIKALNYGLVSQDFQFMAPRVIGGNLQFPNFAGDPATWDDAGGDVLDPATSFTLQLYWQLLGKAYFSNNYDVSFNEESRIFILGTGDAPNVASSEIVTYEDPVTHQTFAAFDFGYDTAGSGLIDKANMYKSMSNMCDGNCQAPTTGFTRDAMDAELMLWNEVLKSNIELDEYFNFGNPFYP